MKVRHLWLLASFALLTVRPAAAESTAPPATPTWDELMTDSVKALRDNRLPQAIDLCDQATRMARGFATNDTRLSRSQTLRAEIYMWEKNCELAEKTFQLAIQSCEKAVGPNDPAMVHPLSSLANFYYFVLQRYDQVIVLFERILRIVESSPAHPYRDEIMWSRNLASVYQTTGQFVRAEPLFQRAVALAMTNDPEWLPHELLTAAEFYRAWHKCDQAESLAKHALELREKALANTNNVDARLDVAVALDTLGAVYLAWPKPDQAAACYQRSLDLVQSFLSPNDADLAPRLAGLAEARHLQGKEDQASPLYRRALVIVEANAGPDSPEAAALRERFAALQSKNPDSIPVESDSSRLSQPPVAGLK